MSRVLGEGGMGLVYLAHDRRTGLPVAIKVMSRQEFDPELQARFLKENRILSVLNHRNIVRCYEITESREGVLSIVMEYVDGVDFRAFEGRPFPELLPLMIQALMGLAYLRTQNVLHRDLSSNNIFVTLENQTRVTKILDFGVAKILQEQGLDGDVKTRTGQFLGKFAFASPELIGASTVDWRSDVYSLGVIFHRLLTGNPPITVARKANYFDWLIAHQKENAFEVEAPADVPPVPDPLRNVVRQMLSRSPDDRPQSYEEIIHVLDRIQRGLPPELEPDPLALRTLPAPVEGRIGSSGSRPTPSSPSQPPPAVRFAPAAVEAESPAFVEASQQKRWPDLDTRESHTERFAALTSPPAPPSPPSPAVPASPPPPGVTVTPETHSGASPSATEQLPSPESADASQTAPTVVPENPEEFPVWTGGAAKDSQPEPVRSSSDLLEDKTERLDDVLEKMRQQSFREPLPPLKAPSVSRTLASATPPESVRRDEPAPASDRAPERAPAAPPAPPKKGRRLVVYGEPPPAAAVKAPPPAMPSAVAPPASVPAPDATGRRIRGIGIGLIIAAIVVLFAAVLWVLISLLRGGSTGDTRRSSYAGPPGAVAAAALRSVRPKPE
ncbi:MAG TPA: serine/threonine-protein kinase [Thermoanaerobaculia bacterium]